MYIAKVVDGQIVEQGDSSGIFSNVSFPGGQPSIEWLAEQSYYPIVSHPFDQNTQKLQPVTPYFTGSEVFIDEVVDLTPEEIAEREAAALQAKRSGMNVSPFQAKAALLQAGQLDAVEAAVTASSDPLIKLAWVNAIQYQRLSPMVVGIGEALSWTDQELDQLFEAAALIGT